jgi:hypothetical protein
MTPSKRSLIFMDFDAGGGIAEHNGKASKEFGCNAC